MIVGLGLLTLAVGTSYFFDPEAGPLVVALFGVPICTVGLWVAARGLLLRIGVAPDAVALRGMWRTRHLRREEITAVKITEVFGVLGTALTVGFALADGSEASLGATAAYQGWRPLARTRAYRQAQAAAQVLDLPFLPSEEA
ncbi:MAG: hypothetical protein KJ792_15795 [Actinobacteria bacterium]|nr:hypothetical protein [Actinomycetota bacterium]MCG2802393.1 hypothetical protein [Cellulomonas sp.]